MIARKLIIFVLLFFSAIACAAVVYLKQFDFNEPRALEKWGNMILNGRVNYMLMRYGNNGYIEAASDKTCSALYYRIGFNLRNYPFLAWKWRVLKFPDTSSVKTDKEKDDYAARVYVIFPFLNFSSSRFIEYIWAEDLPIGTIKTSPVSGNVRQIVVRSGRIEGGQWVNERRNVYEDYIKAFGRNPTMRAGAVAIMCDADNTKSSAEALFDDIAIRTKEE